MKVNGLVSLDLYLHGPQAHSYTTNKDYLVRCWPASSAVLLCPTKSHTIFLCLAIHTLNHTQPSGIMWISVSCPKTLRHSAGARDQTNGSLISKLKANAYTLAINLPECAKCHFFAALNEFNNSFKNSRDSSLWVPHGAWAISLNFVSWGNDP